MAKARTFSTSLTMLKKAGLRPTRQRLALCRLLFENGFRHVCAEHLYDEATSAKVRVSLATIYNTLHQFHKSGMLNDLNLGGGRAWFDTNTLPHHHFYIPEDQQIIDIPAENISFSRLPPPPYGRQVRNIGVMITLE